MRGMKILCITFIITLVFLCGCDTSDSFSKKPLLVLTFDDNSKTIYDVAFPLMQEFSFVGTTVVNSCTTELPGHSTWEELTSLYSAGWELAGHTVHHVLLTEVSIEEAEQEIVIDLQAFREHGFNPISFALPSGKVSIDVLDIISRYYKYIRNSADTINYYPVDVKAVGYYPMQTFYTPEHVFNRLQLASLRGECLVIIGFHKFFDEDENLVSNCQPQEFLEILQFIKDQSFEVVTLSHALERLQ